MATTIYVRLIDEDVPCWRPVQALEIEPGRFRIVESNPQPDVERWEFNVDQVVRCAPRPDGQLRATELVPKPHNDLNREWVLFHLREAREELERTIADIESHPDFGAAEFLVAITHAYHHVNTAWNARNATPARAEACTEDDFYRWRQFPNDIYLDS